MRLDLPVIRVTPPAAGSAGSIQNGLRRIRMRPASDDADGFDLRVETGGAFLLEAAQPPVHGLAGHPGCFRRLGRGPTPWTLSTSNRRPNGVNRLLLCPMRASLNRGCFSPTTQPGRHSLTKHLPSEPKAGSSADEPAAKTVNHVHGKYT